MKREVEAINTVTSRTTHLSTEPLLQVKLPARSGGQVQTVTAMADTGAQVYVAGPVLMSSLGLWPPLLRLFCFGTSVFVRLSPTPNNAARRTIPLKSAKRLVTTTG